MATVCGIAQVSEDSKSSFVGSVPTSRNNLRLSPFKHCGDALGAVSTTTVTSNGTTPINLLWATRMADVLIRQGALSAVEINEMTAYWEGLYK